MLQALFGQGKALIGKSFLLAGLLPASVFLLGYNWYFSGSLDTVASEIRDSLAEPSKMTADVIVSIGLLFSVGLILFAARGFVFNMVADFPELPVSFVSRLRRRRVERHRKRRSNYIRKWEGSTFRTKAAEWYQTGFSEPEPVPNDARELEDAVVSQNSKTIRGLIEKDLKRLNGENDDFPIDNLKNVGGALYDLYLLKYRKTKDEKIDSEIAEWKMISERREVKEYLNKVSELFYSDWKKWNRLGQKYPASGHFVKPSAFGNRLSALGDYAESLYGINTITLWPRLSWVLKRDELSDISDKQLLIETYLNLSLVFLALLITVLSSAVMRTWKAVWSIDPAIDWHTVLFGFVALVLAMVAYYGSILAVESFGESVKSLVDLRWLQLLPALGYKPPFSVGEARELLTELNLFFAGLSQGWRDPDRVLFPLGSGGTGSQDASDGASDK